VAAGLTVALGAVCLASGNNLLYLVVSVLVALWVAELLLGAWNVRGLEASRRLPIEVFADLEAPGRLVLRNRRRWIPAIGLEIVDPGTGASGFVSEVPAGGQGASAVSWRFPHRGVVHLHQLNVVSRFPFGWMRHDRMLAASAELVVYPRPSSGDSRALPGEDAGDAHAARALRGGGGDFVGLRPYALGDRARSIHWPTSARAGQPMVVQRSSDAERAVRVVVTGAQDASWEREISRASGELLRGFSRGWRVGLEVPAETGGAASRRWPARQGAGWRRALLEVLARLPEAP
jgi:uncharacterized protein (DUF58 family)